MWLLREDVARAITQATAAGVSLSAEKREEFVATRTQAGPGGEPRGMKIAGDVAEIRVEGTLTPKPDIFAYLFGGGNTTYEDICAGFARAAQDPAIKRVELRLNSPGGSLDGLYETLAVIEAFPKPIRVVASEACSAAYAIAAIAGPIEATTPASKFGSVGVVGKILLEDDVVEIANSESPNKRPDVKTEEGRAVVREYLDSVFDVIADAIAHGRETTKETVVNEFGRGATLLAGEARRRGMIDKIATPQLRALPKTRTAAEENMNLETLKSNHPELYAAVLLEGKSQAAGAQAAPSASNTNSAPGGGAAETKMDLKTLKTQHADLYEAVLKEGTTAERERVVAHLNMGEKVGDMKIAVDAIKAGESLLNQEVFSKYMCAGMNRNDRAARQTETEAAGKALESAAAPPTTEQDKGAVVADLVEQMLGKKKAG